MSLESPIPLMSAAPAPAAPAADVLEPVSRTARIAEMDFVRGLAVLGIFMVNMPLYAGPASVYFSNEVTGWFPEPYNQAALWFTRIVAESKFYTLFSFLFGLGFGVQMARATARGVEGFSRFYRRRLAVLLGFGLVHLLLFWWGDVLHVYALLGFLLLLFRKRRQKTVLVWSLVLLLLPLVGGTIGFTVQALRQTPARQEERAKKREEGRVKMRREIEEQTRTFADGSRIEVQKLRARQVWRHLPGELFWSIEIFSMFLLGLWFARSGILEDIPGHLALFRRLFWWGLTGGVSLTLILAALRFRFGIAAPDWLGFGGQILGHVVARPLHAAFYGAGMVLLVQNEAWRRRLAPLAAAGRMALTNYLAHTVVCVTLFNGVGFGLFGFGRYGKVGPAAGLVLVFTLYALQLWFSAWWLNRYRFGPMEWAWRSLTYGKRQPMALS